MYKKYHIFIILIFLISLTEGCTRDKNIIAMVNGIPVTRSEMSYWMLLEKADVYRYFYQKYEVKDSENFWYTSCEGEIPIEKLKTKAFNNAKRCKVEQQLSLSKGIDTETNFDSIVSRMSVVNKERSEKIKKGIVIYGPKKFTIRTYFLYLHDKMVYDLKEELRKKELKSTREKLELLNPNDSSSVDKNHMFYEMQYVDKNYDSFIDSLTQKAVVKINISNWKSIYQTKE